MPFSFFGTYGIMFCSPDITLVSLNGQSKRFSKVEGMKKLLHPDMSVKSVFHIPLEHLQNKGIRALIIDLDNTVTEWNRWDISAEAEEWFRQIKIMGFKACIVSNNRGERVAIIARKLGIPSISKATKPRRRAFTQALKLLNVKRCEAAVVGDQIFTDILGGNRMGLLTVLVDPISRREFFGTRFFRFLERAVRKPKK